ncbi:MFS transporter [Rhodovulum sulfidophilum]|uniref:MFS transporter n=1 Tax=Rhodovulum sulfidophilum TaxID=35806 RepID=UPI00095328FB|nr:MFS transporter [Rhodovulum sulfidophilum]MBL3553745.1 MFS transporter [Rhodovulum sulfidophilum]OLS47912.1 MFS transporter [Rhodovulum sulfidophilum]
MADDLRCEGGTDVLGTRQWALLASLYSTQYLGLNFFVVALVAILRTEGAQLDVLGLVYMLGLIWPLKLIWAPMIDRFTIGRGGHFRGWLLLTQGLLVLLLLAIGRFDVIDDFPLVYALCLGVALLAATQDIAVDGLACRLLPETGRGLGNGLQIAGGLVGNMVGGGLILMLYPQIGWEGCLTLLAVLTAIPAVQLIGFDEPAWQRYGDATGKLYRRMTVFWWQPGQRCWLGIVLLVSASSGMAYAVLMPLLVDQGWGPARIGLVVNVFGSIAGLVAALISGWLMHRLSRRDALVMGVGLQIAGVAALLLPAWGLTQAAAFGAIAYFLCYNPVSVVMATMMMDRAAPQSAATDFTLQFTSGQFAAIAAMSAGAAMAAQIGYGGVLGVALGAGSVALLLAVGFGRSRAAG